jgi:hypothetical protein
MLVLVARVKMRGTLLRNIAMIFFLSTKAHDYTVRSTLLSDLKNNTGLAGRITLLSYEKLFRMKALPVGTYIFADLERLNREFTEKAAAVWNTLAERRRECGFELLNHPTLSMRRYELLRNLHARGINDFDVRRLTDVGEIKRFPVFIRDEDEHSGSATPLLRSETELQAAIDNLAAEGKSRDNKIIVEFIDVSDNQGIYHWYGAHRVGPCIFPVFQHFSATWVTKNSAGLLTGGEFDAAQRHYVETNPHEATLRSIFDIAHIDYGRIDYAVINDRIQVFEINTNPISLNAKKLLRAIDAVDCRRNSDERIPLKVPTHVTLAIKMGRRKKRYLWVTERVTKILYALGLLRYEEAILAALRKINNRIYGVSPRRRSNPTGDQGSR